MTTHIKPGLRYSPWWGLCLLVFAGMVQAAEFRALRPIRTAAMVQHLAGAAARTPATLKKVSAEVLRTAVDTLTRAWNGNDLEGVMGQEFFDKSRLLDAMTSKVPRDAPLRVLSIQNAHTLDQRIVGTGGDQRRVSLVSVTLRTQLEFNNPANGFQRREGTNEYILRIRQRY